MRTLQLATPPGRRRGASSAPTSCPARWALALLASAMVLAGCRTDNATVLLERDLRLQEDKIYQLQACLNDAQMAREATIRENESLKQELDDATRGGSGASSGPGTGPEDVRPPEVELPGGEGPPRGREKPDLQPPTIELPEPSDPPTVELPPDAQTGDVQAGGIPVGNSGAVPTQLVINKRLTGGMDRDGHGGDEGILVVFEPRDASGRLVKCPGKVSVVAMDPALDGAAARIARWDFDAAEVPNHYLNTVLGRGLQFELPWPGNPPAHKELVVFVRFTTNDGQKLTSDTKIVVSPPGGESVDRETRRDTGHDRAPRSRLKARAPRATDSADASFPDGSEDTVDPREDEAPLEAARPRRPKWQPYR